MLDYNELDKSIERGEKEFYIRDLMGNVFLWYNGDSNEVDRLFNTCVKSKLYLVVYIALIPPDLFPRVLGLMKSLEVLAKPNALTGNKTGIYQHIKINYLQYGNKFIFFARLPERQKFTKDTIKAIKKILLFNAGN